MDSNDTLVGIDHGWHYLIGVLGSRTIKVEFSQSGKIGFMLPCNVIVYVDKGRVFVSAIRPTVAMHMIENLKLADIAKKVEDKFTKMLNNLSMKNNKHPTRKVFDVVCGMELDIENVRHSFEHAGIEYYFCSETCKGHFVDDPEKYAGEN